MTWAIVTGGSGGLGHAICRRLAADGADIVVGYHGNARAAEDVAAEVRATGRRAERRRAALEDATQVEALFDGLEPVTTVVHAAGSPIEQPYLSQVTADTWRAVIDAEVNGFFNLVKAALPHLRRARGSIVAVTSTGLLRYPPRDVLSVAPKAAVTSLVVAVAREEGRYGVRANCVAPGVIEAGIFLRLRESVYTPEVLEAMRRNTALRRNGTAEEVADAVSYLARASFVTGQTLAVDGGYSM